MNERESVARTLGIAAGVAVFCSLLVSLAVLWLRPIQLAYASIERNRAVVQAAGLIERGAKLDAREIVDRFLDLEVRIVDLDTGAFSGDVSPTTYDFRIAMNDPDQTRPIPDELDIASLGRRPIYLPVYVLRSDSEIEQIVLPIYGQGMWATIHGFISIGADFATVEGVAFYEHGETPGIGDRFLEPDWLAQWQGQRVYDDSQRLVFRIGADDVSPVVTDTIDAITGATITVSAIERLVRYWLGDDGFGPFLATQRSEAQQ
ncbi:MAG: NADH:ubiquinone reductase (Na(+)-transporting) subunit C [Gammaproteobacteria bacterium]|nr:NADH:ubiquinone reductase (Na(+)-transporting) subunit C [Gammaproteobacteria bacterium]